ncbi:MAG: Spy/CpxP family protein refolding chaperone [Bryobacteraceae bacterium]
MITRVLFMLVMTGALMAQSPRAARYDELRSYLGLTDTQVSQMQTIQSNFRTEVRALRQAQADKQKGLRDALNAGTTDAAAVGRLVLDIDSGRKQISAKRDAMETQAAGVLNTDQQTRLKALTEAADLRPVLRQAIAAGLVERPQGAGMGRRPGFGPGAEARPRMRGRVRPGAGVRQ